MWSPLRLFLSHACISGLAFAGFIAPAEDNHDYLRSDLPVYSVGQKFPIQWSSSYSSVDLVIVQNRSLSSKIDYMPNSKNLPGSGTYTWSIAVDGGNGASAFDLTFDDVFYFNLFHTGALSPFSSSRRFILTSPTVDQNGNAIVSTAVLTTVISATRTSVASVTVTTVSIAQASTSATITSTGSTIAQPSTLSTGTVAAQSPQSATTGTSPGATAQANTGGLSSVAKVGLGVGVGLGGVAVIGALVVAALALRWRRKDVRQHGGVTAVAQHDPITPKLDEARWSPRAPSGLSELHGQGVNNDYTYRSVPLHDVEGHHELEGHRGE